MNMRILHFKSINSTHLYALDLLENKKDYFLDNNKGYEDLVITADEQTNGVGRCGRTWLSPKGNLFASIIMNKQQQEYDLGQFSLTIACAVRESIACYLSEVSKQHLKLHWPNDVYFREKKISGILIAVSGDFFIISVGINLNNDFALFDEKINAVAMCEIIENYKDNRLYPDKVLSILIKKIYEWISLLRDVGFSEVRSYWLKNINNIDCDVTIKNGNDVLKGRFLDINEDGRVILENNSKRLLISSGDLFVNQNEIGYSCE